MPGNRAVVYVEPGKVEVWDIDYPDLVLRDGPGVNPRNVGRKCEHGVILKVVSTNICGSDQHMVRGRTTAPSGLVLGHEITGEVIEVGRDVEFMKKGDLVSVPFNIACGQFVGITGPVGAGKSTLLRLLNRDYEVAEGRIFLGGRDIKEWPLQVLHEVIGVVQQRPFVFSKTIRDNIGVNGEKASEEQVKMAAELADLTETIASFSQRYDTFVGERGVTLSGGQKSRLAMARAFLVNGSILLFDNVFSAVDTATEQKIFTRMRQHFQGKTVLLVTHRVSVLEQMDQILYMVGGSIVESGLPKDLVEKKGHYAALVELQTMEERLYERNW